MLIQGQCAITMFSFTVCDSVPFVLSPGSRNGSRSTASPPHTRRQTSPAPPSAPARSHTGCDVMTVAPKSAQGAEESRGCSGGWHWAWGGGEPGRGGLGGEHCPGPRLPPALAGVSEGPCAQPAGSLSALAGRLWTALSWQNSVLTPVAGSLGEAREPRASRSG